MITDTFQSKKALYASIIFRFFVQQPFFSIYDILFLIVFSTCLYPFFFAKLLLRR